jgi:hypothetical protein
MSTFNITFIKSQLILVLISGFSSLSLSQQPSKSDLAHTTQIQQEFKQFNPDYIQMKAERIKKVRELYGKVSELEDQGKNSTCSHQILWEIKALITQTADFTLLDRRLNDLDLSLTNPLKENITMILDSVTGNWGNCFDQWFCKLSSFCEEIGREENKNSTLKFQPHFLDQINSPEKLTNYLMTVSVSDIPKTGTDNLLEFNESISNLMRLILRDRPKGYSWDPKLKETLMDLILNQFRNTETGWWGESYVRNGQVQFVDDLSTTFHIVTYLNGNVPDLHRIISTTLAVKDINFPIGWLWNGNYWNHNNMDVVALFKAGWPYADDKQKKTIAFEIQKMLDWCLNESFQANGSFKPHIGDGSLEEGVYYGVSFLGRIGFFDKSECFWTNQKFSKAKVIRKKIIKYILSHKDTGGSGGSYYESALTDYLSYKPFQKTDNK